MSALQCLIFIINNYRYDRTIMHIDQYYIHFKDPEMYCTVCCDMASYSAFKPTVNLESSTRVQYQRIIPT